MATISSSRHDTHATTATGGWSTKRIATTALFCAVAAIATLFLEFPILPGVTFLKYDPSAIVALVAGFAFGPSTGVLVSVLPYLVHLATQSGVYGALMAIIATLSLVLPASLVYQRNTSYKGAITGMVVVRSAEQPIMSQFSSIAVLMKVSGATSTPRSITSKPFPSSIMMTRFLPIS